MVEQHQQRLSWTQVLILILMFVLATAFAYRLMTERRVDSDTLWHIKTGEYIVQHRQIPRTDIFSWYGKEQRLPWLPHEWLFDIGIYWLFALGGFVAVYIAAALCVGALVPAVFGLTYLRTRRWVTSLIVALLAVAGVARFIAPRPQVVTFILIVLVALLLEKRWPYAALPLLVIGVNVHGAMYPMYLAVFAFYLFPTQLLPLGLAALAVLAQPYGVGLLRYPFFAFDSQVVLFQEYAPVVLAREWLLLPVLLLLVLLVDRKRVPFRVGLTVILLALLGLRGVRHTSFFYLLGIPAIAPYLRYGREPVESRGAVEADEGTYRDAAPAWFNATIVALLAIGCVVSIAGVWGSRIDVDKGYPAKALAYVRAKGITHVMNDWGDGGYLIFKGVDSFVDGRADPFSPFFRKDVTLAKDLARVWYVEADVRPFLDKYGVTHVMIPANVPLARVLEQSEDFERVFSADGYVVYRYR